MRLTGSVQILAKLKSPWVDSNGIVLTFSKITEK